MNNSPKRNTVTPLMEYRCDENAVKHCSLAEKIDYVETLKKWR